MKKIIICLILIFSISISFADAASNLIEKIKNINSMTANFNQKLIDGQTSNSLNSKGNMSLKKPQYFKWVTTSPNNQKIVSNGTKLWIYDGDLDQIIIKKVSSNNISQFPYLILLSKNTSNINKLFTVKEQDNTSYILKPKNDQMINSIKIKFTPNNQLKYLEISTSLNQFTKIEFTDVKTDVYISDTSFDFKAPEDTDVIDETKST
ncbi:membrane protein [Francisella persica ATCC VR-331]|uniref:Outer-membrane lipoprotein carrier protein n=1 Tax=Francisella persica ATCC VR-331 TaxID=1086726 RepID=A0AAC8VEU6_9GAMM|nr:outer membrane lipoprotein chaperone LolA [Francisella persica]ALB02002.1 membrane protein [Francisella persica ATCC VR-331]ANH77256.1 outer membrane lipoprotein carrier protein LolA [Francisella persica ATCC VR-331]